MLSRWYSLFIGFLLVVLGIAGLVAARGYSMLFTTSVIWLIVAVAALWVGFGVRDLTTVRWFAGIIGAILFVWGIIQLIAAPVIGELGLMTAVASVGGFMVLLGSLGLSAALVTTTWAPEPRPAMT